MGNDSPPERRADGVAKAEVKVKGDSHSHKRAKSKSTFNHSGGIEPDVEIILPKRERKHGKARTDAARQRSIPTPRRRSSRHVVNELRPPHPATERSDHPSTSSNNLDGNSVIDAMRNAAGWAISLANALRSGPASVAQAQAEAGPLHLPSTPGRVTRSATKRIGVHDELEERTETETDEAPGRDKRSRRSKRTLAERNDERHQHQHQHERQKTSEHVQIPSSPRISSPYFKKDSKEPASRGQKRSRATQSPKSKSKGKAEAEAEADTDGPVSIHGLPRSSNFFGLIQELVAPDIWRLLVATTLLNQTRGRAAIPVFWALLARWPTQYSMARADLLELTAMLQPLGLHNVRAKRLITLSLQMVENPPDPSRLFKTRGNASRDTPMTQIGAYVSVGAYALDSYRIFIMDGGAQRGLGPRPRAPALLGQSSEVDVQSAWTDAERAEAEAERAEAEAEASLPAPAPCPARPRIRKQGEGRDDDERKVAATDEPAWNKDENERKRSSFSSSDDRMEERSLPEPGQEQETPEWKKVMPLDKELRRYLIWRWARDGVRWDPERGVVGQLEREWTRVRKRRRKRTRRRTRRR